MSVTISLKQTMARRTDAALHLVQHGLMIFALLAALCVVNVFMNDSPTLSGENLKAALPEFAISATADADEAVEAGSSALVAGVDALSPQMHGALEYVTHRYRVSQEALLPVFEAAQLIGRERHLDPLLIVAVIGVESGFNPFAESAMGAQGLMQVIPRYHKDKVPEGAGKKPFLDPATNIRVGASILEDAIRRQGGLVAGLQYYAGSSSGEAAYAQRVLAEKQRLENAARRGMARSSV